MRVKVNTLYRYVPNTLDRVMGVYNMPETNDIVRVFNMHGCPKANTFGHCYIQHLGGEFCGLVSTHSLIPLTVEEKREVRKARTATKYRRPTPRFNLDIVR